MGWKDLDDQQYFYTLKTMETLGGGFVHNLAQAWTRADSYNRGRLEQAFPDMVERYGPPSTLYIHKESSWQ